MAVWPGPADPVADSGFESLDDLTWSLRAWVWNSWTASWRVPSHQLSLRPADCYVKLTPIYVPFLALCKLPTYSGGINLLVLEWLLSGGLQFLDCGDAPFGEVTTVWTRLRMGHANAATAPDVAGPRNSNLKIWKQNSTFGWIWNAIHQTMDGRHCRLGRSWSRDSEGHWFSICQEAFSESYYSSSI